MMRKLLILFFATSLFGAFVYIAFDVLRGPDLLALRFTGVVTLIMLPFIILCVKICPKRIQRILICIAAVLCSIGTLAITLLSVWGITRAWTTWQEESWLFITGFTLFASVAIFLWYYFFKMKGEHVPDA